MIKSVSALAAFFMVIFYLSSCSSSEKKKVSANTLYYCPMDPDQTSDHPDTCKICGMDMIEDANGEHAHLMDSLSHIH